MQSRDLPLPPRTCLKINYNCIVNVDINIIILAVIFCFYNSTKVTFKANIR